MCLHQSHVFARLYEARRLCVKHDSEQYFKPSDVADENSEAPPNGMIRLHQLHSSIKMKKKIIKILIKFMKVGMIKNEMNRKGKRGEIKKKHK